MSTKLGSKPDLIDLTDEEILKLRFKDIPLPIVGTDVEDKIKQLYIELENKGLVFRPNIFLGDEWFSPEGMNAIAVPFYLANPRLKSLEKSQMLEVEGGTQEWFMRLLRHEAGHCFDHCYKFSKRKKWHQVFGSPNEDYEPETYRPQPYSKSYVKHLDRWYAQAHPDEDFAETFAVWLDPNRDWKKEYSKWPVALKKLEYMGELAKDSPKLKNMAEKGRVPSNVAQLTTTLDKYYQKRRRESADDYPDFYDSDLNKIFNGDVSLSKREFSALKFMKKHRKATV
ncbi:MAG: putative zinc-binding metallopeptidase, partial [Pseudobdellovibrio sp.]